MLETNKPDNKHFPQAESEFDPDVHANLVVDGAYVVPDDVCVDPELCSDFSIFQTLGNEHNN